ncbi:YfbM family protein [Fusobacterium sp.]|uniref:YfbM family protein n=1 Tax=Fusobacterium sp. TaxID=68766 RepID=UPI00396C920C
MEMIATYQILNDKELNLLLNISGSDRYLEFVERLQERNIPLLEIGNMWDMMHFIFCGISASEPIEEYPLSESVVGENIVCEDYFISFTSKKRMYKIVRSLENIDFEKVISAFELENYRKNTPYNKKMKMDKNIIFSELRENFEKMKKFYRMAYEKRENVIVSIY